MKTYMHNVEEDLPEDTRTLAEQQRDALLAACGGVDLLYAVLSKYLPDLVGTESFDIVTEAVSKARKTISAVKAGKVPS